MKPFNKILKSRAVTHYATGTLYKVQALAPDQYMPICMVVGCIRANGDDPFNCEQVKQAALKHDEQLWDVSKCGPYSDAELLEFGYTVSVMNVNPVSAIGDSHLYN